MSLGFRATDGILMHAEKIGKELLQMTQTIEIEQGFSQAPKSSVGLCMIVKIDWPKQANAE